ncbi:ribosomal protein subunit L37 [Schizosaccharomyces japonicus yFS275]|uniref:Large ribosomal subunit protein mL54 n=1 Tax=Schizosaccharomyces japonicus (strain yFS275 / FY16936) TaxID=402676 RepID=B6JYN8_SCHJY|nr:ribosomal protein subunit L37 [Schizosaccharomyces japonicus yFS275]EEB06656.1 ribosomal protein subunit L37 [Schizosaccharomyces japonicus yFS275]
MSFHSKISAQSLRLMRSLRNLRLGICVQARLFSRAAPLFRPPSSTVAGTIMKGLSIHKNEPDPVAKEDNEYPDWLWTLLDETKPVLEPTEIWKQPPSVHRRARKQSIRMENLRRKT